MLDRDPDPTGSGATRWALVERERASDYVTLNDYASLRPFFEVMIAWLGFPQGLSERSRSGPRPVTGLKNFKITGSGSKNLLPNRL